MNTLSLLTLALQTSGSFIVDPKFTIQDKLGLPVSPVTINVMPKISLESISSTWTDKDAIWVSDPIPWIVRPVEQDLTEQEIARYRGRKIISHGDKNFAAYYLRTRDMSGTVTPAMLVVNDNEYSASITNTASLTDTYNVGEGHAVAHMQTSINISAAERAEINSGIALLGLQVTHIKTYCMCSGVDHVVPRAGGTDYTESKAAWLVQAMQCNLSLTDDDISNYPVMVLVV